MLVSTCAPFSPFYYHKQPFLFIYIGPELFFMFFTYYFIWSAPNPCVDKYHCQASLTKGDSGSPSDEKFPELNLVPGTWCLEPRSPDWTPCLFWYNLLCLVTYPGEISQWSPLYSHTLWPHSSSVQYEKEGIKQRTTCSFSILAICTTSDLDSQGHHFISVQSIGNLLLL